MPERRGILELRKSRGNLMSRRRAGIVAVILALAGPLLPHPGSIEALAGAARLTVLVGVATAAGGSLLQIRDLITMAGRTRHYLAIFDDHDGRPLYLGRAKRLATADQRLLLCATDRGCSFPGCSMPASMSDVHHLREWADGGTTDITNLTLVCPTHHQLAGSGPHRWRTTKSPGGRTRWTPPHHIDPTQDPA